ncbi:MAG: aldehyde dehydrogenase (NADP(+)) [Flavobacteriales bacterium]|nr:aldehyde dehydrogenase (NADP(+)) [Flavobacteriales bacterium]
MISGENYIGSKRSAKGSVQFKTFNPILNLENEHTFTEANEAEIQEAVELAHQAFLDFQAISGAKKAEFLNCIADEILNLEELIPTYMNESGLPEGRAIGERGRTVFQLRSFAELVAEGSWVEARIDTAIPDRTPLPKTDLRKMNIPIGPIVVFGASNFPLAYSTAGGDTASALAAGCPVIVKAHPMHAGTSELVASAIITAAQKTGMPEGVFSNLNSNGIEVGVSLVKHPKVKGVGFTGSIQGGRALFDLAAQREEPIPVFAEMGSINPVVLFPEYLEKNAESAAKTYASSITLGMGQFCTNPGLILGVESSGLSTFISTLGEEILTIEPMSMLHPNIEGNYQKGLSMMEQEQVQVISKYEADVQSNFARQMVATVSGAEFLKNNNLHKEVFGPYSLVVRCQSIDELHQIIQNLEGQLTGTLLAEGNELSQYQKVVNALRDRVGRLIFNGVPTGVEVCPSMLHGGPYPASTDSRFTAVGIDSIQRWVRPVSYQNWPDQLLPAELQNSNPLNIIRKVDNADSRDKIG